MPHTVIRLPLLLALACGSSTPADDSGVDATTDARDAGDAQGDAQSDGNSDTRDTGPGAVSWEARGCDFTLAYTPAASVASVQVVGEFVDAPLELEDGDGDGTFEIVLSPSARLRGGELHAYKIVVDGESVLDPNETHRRFHEGCIHSAFRMPACDTPEIVASEVVTRWDDRSMQTRLTIHTAADGAPPRDIVFTIDGVELPESATVLDSTTGSYDVTSTDLTPGRHVLGARVTDESDRVAEPVDLPFWIEDQSFEWQDATVYSIVVDRFANGDRSSDSPVGAPVERPADFHGGDLEGVAEVMRSGYFEELGINVIALSPLHLQAMGHSEELGSSRRVAAYHGEWPSRAREIEPRFGGEAALRDLIDEAHARGIRVIFHLANGHVHEQHEYYLDHPEWFRMGCICDFDAGCGVDRRLDCQFASYLPDIDWRQSAAEQQIIDDAVYWVEEFGVDGFRLDAIEHTESNAVFNLRARLARRFEQGDERIFLFGETDVGAAEEGDLGCGVTYPNGFAWIDSYVGDNALDGQLDVPTHRALRDGLTRDQLTYTSVEAFVRDAETGFSPEALHIRYLGGHDSNRVASRAAFDPAADCAWVGPSCVTLATTPSDAGTYARLRRAYTILYTLPGIPLLYYGDELAIPGGQVPDNRRDMVWSGELASVAMGETTTSTLQDGLRNHLQALGQARRESVALRRGNRVPLSVTDDLYVYGYEHDDRGQLALVAVNRGGDVNDVAVDLTTDQVGDITSFETVAGVGTASLDATRLTLTLAAGDAAVFLGR